MLYYYWSSNNKNCYKIQNFNANYVLTYGIICPKKGAIISDLNKLPIK